MKKGEKMRKVKLHSDTKSEMRLLFIIFFGEMDIKTNHFLHIWATENTCLWLYMHQFLGCLLKTLRASNLETFES